MEQRRILLTGAGSGLGRSLAGALAERGHHLLLADRDAAGLQETVAAIEASAMIAASAALVSPFVLDVTSSAQIEAVVAQIGEASIDVLINNAGLQFVSPLEEFPEERWDMLIDVMLKGPFLLSKSVLPVMRRFGFGRIINIGSIHSLIASPYKGAYVAAKHGLLGLAKVLALETAGTDVTVNTICPAYIRTPLMEAQIQAQARANGIPEDEVIRTIMLEPMPKSVFITVEEITATMEFLMSDAARNITGQTIVIDGGWTAR